MVMSLTPELRGYFGAAADRGVLVARVEPNSPAAAAGVAVGDVLVEVKGHEVAEAPDVLETLLDTPKGERVPLVVVRRGKSQTLTATLADPPTQRSAAWPSFAPPWLRDWMKPSQPGLRPHERT